MARHRTLRYLSAVAIERAISKHGYNYTYEQLAEEKRLLGRELRASEKGKAQ